MKGIEEGEDEEEEIFKILKGKPNFIISTNLASLI